MRRARIHASWYTLGDLLLLGLAAYFASQAAFGLLEPPLPSGGGGPGSGLPGSGGGPRGAPVAASSGAVLDEVAGAVVARNLFGSRTLTLAGGPGDAAAPVSTVPLPLQLLGTVVDSGGGRSLAILDDTEARKQVVLLVGESIRPGAILASVTRNRVVFLRDGREEVIEKTRDASSPRAPAPSGAVGRPVPQVDKGTGGGEDAIKVRQTGENQYVVDRREIEGAMGNLSQLAAQVRLVPNFSEGKADGFRIFNIRPNSLFSRLGVANGDVLRRVNGLEISGAEQALQAFTQLKESSSISLDISRANRNLTLQFEVR